jgi:hypothetical protein
VFIMRGTFDTEGLGLGLGIYWKLEASTSSGRPGYSGSPTGYIIGSCYRKLGL